MAPDNNISYRADEKLIGEIEQRTNERRAEVETRHKTARAMAERFVFCMEKGLENVALTEGEAHVILSAHNGIEYHDFEARVRTGIWAEVETAEDGLFDHWGVKRKVVVRKLKELGLVERLAVLDAVDRFWNAEDEDLETTARSVGLVQEDKSGRNGPYLFGGDGE